MPREVLAVVQHEDGTDTGSAEADEAVVNSQAADPDAALLCVNVQQAGHTYLQCPLGRYLLFYGTS
jgi:hypothetical protein